ncbi:hypothetical protein ACFC26_43190 [Kitasatospora purpeofusca]|uniref:hypothetical protein n=1 Tax=Kitasatospora purpeofusca TaxID=67352 RepID=UPI0035E288DE
MKNLLPEKIFPTERATPEHRLRIVATLAYPVTGLMAGTPVLIRKLTAPQRERRAEAAALKGRAAELLAEADKLDQEAFAKKLAEADPAKRPAMIHAREAARVAAKEAAAEQAKADRKTARSKFGDAAGAGALLLIIGGPLVWSLARPLIGPGIGLLIGAWWIAALIHAPSAEKTGADTSGSTPQTGQDDVREQPVPTPDQEPAPALSVTTEPTPTDARDAVALLGVAGTHVALTAVAAHLAAEHPLWERSGKALRALLREAGVRVRDGVKVDGVSVPGIHHDDVPPLPSPSGPAPWSVVVAGQSNNNNHNNAQEWATREGFVMQTDPDNPARTIVVHTPAA